MSNSSTWPIDRNLSGATTLGQRGPGSDSNEGILYVLHRSSITGAQPSECLMSFRDTRRGSYLSAEMQSVNSPPTTDKAWGGGDLQT